MIADGDRFGPAVRADTSLPRDLLADASGQAATEYALLAFWTMFIIAASIKTLQAALLDYYQDVASLICLPIP